MTSIDHKAPLDERVYLELLELRKSRFGITVDSIAHANVICQLLGAGDPFLAYSRIRHEILNSDFGLPIMAAAASLGLTVKGEGHLNRLTSFGSELYLDQRQVRRYSDKGLRELARMIVTNWPTETSPELSLFLFKVSTGWEIQIFGRHLHVIEMSDPLVTVLIGATKKLQNNNWNVRESDNLSYFSAHDPLIINSSEEETSIVVVWRGELWPKFNAILNGVFDQVMVEALGNKFLVRLNQLSTKI